MNDNLYGWILTYNPFEDEWKAVYGDEYFSLFNGGEGVLRVKGIGNVMIVVELISKTNGNINEINKLLNE